MLFFLLTQTCMSVFLRRRRYTLFSKQHYTGKEAIQYIKGAQWFVITACSIALLFSLCLFVFLHVVDHVCVCEWGAMFDRDPD